jgi:UDP-N-acetylenolpyruvoylglucosamine reductase
MTDAAAILDCPMPTERNLANELADHVSRETLIRRDEPLAKRTTLRVGGPADLYVEPASEADLAAVLRWCGEHAMGFFVLVGDQLRSGAGARLKQVAVEAKRHGLSGLEFLEGIPGSVGGALRMNAGAMGGATFDVVKTIRVMDYLGSVHELVPGQFQVEYRCCPLLKNHIALGADFQGRPASREEIERRMNEFSRKRWDSQPAAPSAGCMFKNPAAIPAGRLIDELGFKGRRVGGAMVSIEHGNFIVNDGTATARDVLELIETVKRAAKTGRGIELQTEVEIIGED